MMRRGFKWITNCIESRPGPLALGQGSTPAQPWQVEDHDPDSQTQNFQDPRVVLSDFRGVEGGILGFPCKQQQDKVVT